MPSLSSSSATAHVTGSQSCPTTNQHLRLINAYLHLINEFCHPPAIENILLQFTHLSWLKSLHRMRLPLSSCCHQMDSAMALSPGKGASNPSHSSLSKGQRC
ncbi:hypothetical protein OIU77_015273 [Salix suchowensis]|uniref:Uncharacterized protein n=1 Tax=Salix suchowensis TaxID=1278906 RepID=A0ABQ8ZSE9_9ROSI|nr:hypothetical protein OIU77_015273 [Salix suchowensis]